MSSEKRTVGITVAATGASLTTGAASARVAIPVNGSGQIPRWVRLAALNACYARIGDSSVTAAATDILVQPADAVIVRTWGNTHIAGIQDASAGKLIITPLEDL